MAEKEWMIEHKDVQPTVSPTLFVEEEVVPADSVVTGYDWAKSNKDGSRDMRFNGNYQIPVARFAELNFARSWQDITTAIDTGGGCCTMR